MFTGIIETFGTVADIIYAGSNASYRIASPISHELGIDQSVAHDGVCLTVEEVGNGQHKLTAVEETLVKTNLANWKIGTVVNMERCMQLNDRLDGHIVQGHVDTIARCTSLADKKGSWEFSFRFDKKFASLLVEKGSVTLNGISLTLFGVQEDTFSVAIIPYTYLHTNMQFIKPGDEVNIEFDMIGKYVNRIMQFK